MHNLLQKDEPILTATRDGLNLKHDFTKALKSAVEEQLEPLVEEERRRAQEEEKSAVSKKLRERLNFALRELNSIASAELGKLTDGTNESDKNGGKLPFVPPSGFGFVPEFVYVQTGKPAGLTLRAAIPDKVTAGCLVTIESDNPEVRVLTSQVAIEAREDFTGIGQARVELEGGQVGTEAVITARLDGLKAEAMVKVVSKREPPSETQRQKHSGGLFRDVKFDGKAEPRQRVRFAPDTSCIVIATRAPSVAPYLDETGKGSDEPQTQVLLAELVTEAVCREIARRGVANGNFLSPAGSETDAIQREYIRLQNQYAHSIHAQFVDPQFRHQGGLRLIKKGRPSREEALSHAVIEA